MLLTKGDTLLITGDSITDAGVARPLGYAAGLGNGYPMFVNAILTSMVPEMKIRVLNTGHSGDRSVDLAARWDEDVLAHRPDWR